MRRLVFLAALALAATASAQAPALDGLFAGTPGSGIAVFNPEEGAPLIHVTPSFVESLGVRADTLGGEPRTTGHLGSRQTSFSPSLSATGRMAFVADWLTEGGASGFRIYAVDRDGSDPAVLTPIYSNPTDWERSTPRPRISPDGETVVYTVVQPGGGNRAAVGSLWTVPADGSAPPTEMVLPLAENAEGQCAQVPLAATFSPDGADILYLGVEPATYRLSGDPDLRVACHPALRRIGVDGTDDRLVHATVPLNGSGESSPLSVQIYHDAQIALDWRGDTIVYSGPSYLVRFEGPDTSLGEELRFVHAWTGESFTNEEAPDVALGYKARSVRISPDGTRIGFVRDLAAGNAFEHRIAVRPIDPGGEEVVFDALDLGRFYGFDWADLPALAAPASFALEADTELSWAGRAIDLRPTLRAADGTVLSRTARFYTYGTQTDTRVNHFTGELWGTLGTAPPPGRNKLREEHCAQNAGLEACWTVDNVNVPILGLTVVDDGIAEAGRDPGLFRIWRYGRPDIESIPLFEGLRNGSGVADALHYLDYTLSVLPERLRWAPSDALADTLQSLDIVLTPIDDGVDEPAVERGRLRLACAGATGSIFGPDEERCATAVQGDIPTVAGIIGANRQETSVIFEIASNGAGSGLALTSSAPGVIPASGQATLTIQGQGVEDGATVRLSGPGAVTAEHVAVLHGGVQARARFVLDDLPPGTYDLTVESDGATATLAGAVAVEAETPGGTTDVWATLESRSARPGLPLTQYVLYGNDGTADAGLTPLLIAFPPGYDVAFTEPLYQFPDMPSDYDPTASPWRTVTVTAAQVPGLCVQSRGSAGGSVECFGSFLPSEPLDYTVAVVFLPTIPPGGQGRLGIDVTKQVGAETLPWFVKVGAPFNTLEFEEGDEAGRLASQVWAGGRRPVSPTNVQGCGTARLAGMDPLTDARAAACAGCLGAVLNVIFDSTPYGQCAKAAIGLTLSTYQAFIDGAANGAGAGAASGAGVLTNLVKTAAACGGAAAVTGTGPAAILYSAMSILAAGADFLSNAQNCFNCFGIDPVWGVVGEIYSTDPNDKLGPIAVGDAGYVSEFGRMGYTVRFENLATATASAVEVIVTDTLDTAVYDLATFELGPVSLRDTTFTPPAGLQTWTTFWDRRPADPSVVRVHGALDAETGVATWTLSDLDPTDYRLRTSAEAGFLPPNDADGAGEGWVRFSVRAHDGLPGGTVAANGATIRFDRNELIATPTWANTLDLTAPVSRALAAEPFDADTSWVVRLEGADDGAGVAGFDVYAQADDGPFVRIGAADADSLVFRGAPGVVYGFFALATDWVGNDEPPKTEAEAMAGSVDAADGPSGPAELSLAAPYPNPTRGAAVVQVGVPTPGPVRVAVYDALGREVAVLLDGERPAGWHAVRWEGSAAAGVYVVRVAAGDAVATRTFTVVR